MEIQKCNPVTPKCNPVTKSVTQLHFGLIQALVFLGIVGLLILGTGIYLQEEETSSEFTIKDRYKSQIFLNTLEIYDIREPTTFDAYTGIDFYYDDAKYNLYESRTIKSGDFGKAFLHKVER